MGTYAFLVDMALLFIVYYSRPVAIRHFLFFVPNRWYIKRIRGEASEILMATSINNQ